MQALRVHHSASDRADTASLHRNDRAAAAAETPRSIEQPLSGWSHYDRQTCRVYRPEKLSDLRRVVASAADADLISRGLGRSYCDAALNAGSGVISHLKLNRLLAFDEATGLLECEAGVSLDDIIQFALPRGFFPAVSPGTRYVTVGGCIAADVHGKNHHQDGSFAAALVDFRLLTANGAVLRCSRERNSDLFWATVGGMGLTGAILDARFFLREVSSAYVTVDYRRSANLDESLEAFASGDHQYTYSVAWIDCLATGASLGRSVLMRGGHTPHEELPPRRAGEPLTARLRRNRTVPCHLPGQVLNRWSVKAFNALFYHRHRNQRAMVPYDAFFYPLDSLLDWNRIYGKRGFVQYQAAFPTSTSRSGLIALLETIAASRQASFLAVLKSFGEANPGLLSFPLAGHTLALDLPNCGPRLTALLGELDQIVLDHRGRVYLAKNPRLSPAAFNQMYPNAERFRQIKAAIDPRQRFASSLARRLGLLETPRAARMAA